MNTVELIGVILGSNLLIEIIKQFFGHRYNTAGTIKLKNEAGQIVLEGEIKVTEFYKEQLENIIRKYDILENKLEKKEEENEALTQRLTELEAKHTELQRQFTLLNVKIAGEHDN